MVNEKPSRGQAETMAELITPLQLHNIRNLALQTGVNLSTLSERQFDCEPEVLTQPAALWLIEQLAQTEKPHLN